MRQIDPTIVKISSKAMFTIDAGQKLCTKLLKHAGLSLDKATVDLELFPLSKTGTIRFLGELRTATLRAKQLLESQRIDKKSWLQHTIPDSEGHEVSAYVNPDKSPAQIRVEMATKKVRNLLATKYEPKEFEYNRLTGIFSSGWCRLGQVSAPDRSATLLKFNQANCTTHGVDVQWLRGVFATDFGDGETTEFL